MFPYFQSFYQRYQAVSTVILIEVVNRDAPAGRSSPLRQVTPDGERQFDVHRKPDTRPRESAGMETTRHFTATTYIVNGGATALHRHPELDIRLPPGGHIDRDELPHEAAVREVREETGLDPTLLADLADVASDTARAVPRPRHLMLADVNVCGDEVGHQHVDHVFYATVGSRELDPAAGEVAAGAWDWYAPADLREGDVDDDVRVLGTEAVEVSESVR